MSGIRCPMCDYEVDECKCEDRYGAVQPPENVVNVRQTKVDGGGLRFNAGKLRWDLVPPKAMEELVKIYTVSCQEYGGKYPARNWERGMAWSIPFASAQRHLWKFWSGEDVDEESGLLHVAHAAWNCISLIEYFFTFKDGDDRPYKK